MPTDADILRTDLAGLELASPVILAAGTAGMLDEMADAVDLSRVGAVTTKSITVEPRDGNATWRLWPLDVGMINAVGLANPGVERFERDIAPRAKDVACTVIGSVAGWKIEDYVRVASAMDAAEGFAAVELNVSCPNVHGGTMFGVDAGLLGEVVGAVRAACPGTKLFVKMSPVAMGEPGIVGLARVAIENGADGLTVANTTPAMVIDPETRKPVLSRGSGGLSGPAVKPIAVKLVHDVYHGVAKDAGVPVIGLGGVRTWRDAAEFILAGATAVSMGTMLFADPRAPLKVTRGLAQWTRKQGFSKLGELVGKLEG